MDLKKIAPLMIVIIMIGTLIAVQPASAATSHIAIYDSNSDEVTSFVTNSNDECLEIYARLYVDDEWRAWRNLDFDYMILMEIIYSMLNVLQVLLQDIQV